MMSESGALKLLWRQSAPEEQSRYVGHHFGVIGVAVTPDSRYILSISFQDRTLIIWDMPTGQPIQSVRLCPNPYTKIRAVAVAPDSRFAVVGYDDEFHVLDLHDWSRRSIQNDRTVDAGAIAITPDSRFILLGDDIYTHAIRVYDAQNLRIVRNLAGHGGEDWVRDIVVTPDGRYAVSAVLDNIKVWDLESGQQVLTLHDPSKRRRTLAITLDGRTVLYSGYDAIIRIWDWRTGQAVERLASGHAGPISDLALTPDGCHLVSSSDDGTLHIWDWPTRQLKHVCAGHAGSVAAIAVTSDSQRVISGSSDCTIRQWGVRTGALLSASLPAPPTADT